MDRMIKNDKTPRLCLGVFCQEDQFDRYGFLIMGMKTIQGVTVIVTVTGSE